MSKRRRFTVKVPIRPFGVGADACVAFAPIKFVLGVAADGEPVPPPRKKHPVGTLTFRVSSKPLSSTERRKTADFEVVVTWERAGPGAADEMKIMTDGEPVPPPRKPKRPIPPPRKPKNPKEPGKGGGGGRR